MESGLYKILLMIWKLTSSGKKNPGSCFLFLIVGPGQTGYVPKQGSGIKLYDYQYTVIYCL